MNRRPLTVNRTPSASRRPRFTPPRCESTRPGTHVRCMLDIGHTTRHFADGISWDEAA